LPVTDFPYDDSYFDKYSEYEKTDLGKKLNDWRVKLVNRFCSGKVLDIGIGCGSFLKQRGNCFGYDVCKKAVDWLRENDLFLSPYNGDLSQIECVTFFDSFEHIDDLDLIMSRVKSKKIIISIPVFTSRSNAVSSRHFRPNEHFHYFSINALMAYMRSHDQRCIWVSDYESELGRDSIITFCFSPTERKVTA
jgi:hypothetical protein